MNSFTAYLEQKQYSTRSIATYEKALNLYLDWLKAEALQAEQVTYNEVLQYVKHCAKRMNQRSISGYVLVLRHYYDHLILSGQVATNPTVSLRLQGVKKRTLYPILAPHELHALYHTYPAATTSHQRKRIMLGLLLYQGVTTEELRKLKTEDIHLRTGKLTIAGSKRSNSRTLQLESHQVLDLYDYVLQVRPALETRLAEPNETLLALLPTKGYISTLMHQLMTTLKTLNPKVQRQQQLRASVITKWLKMYNLREVQYLTGHRYISSTESYLENDLEGLQEEINQYHPLG